MTTCQDCKFYKERHLDYNGWCRAHPPAWDKKFETCNFPTVMADYWCGEFAATEPVQVEHQYTIEDAVRLVNELASAVFLCAGYNSGENNRDLIKANKAVVDAIVGKTK